MLHTTIFVYAYKHSKIIIFTGIQRRSTHINTYTDKFIHINTLRILYLLEFRKDNLLKEIDMTQDIADFLFLFLGIVKLLESRFSRSYFLHYYDSYNPIADN